MTAPVLIRKVESRADYRAFFEFPWQVYKDDPNWVPPLLSMRREAFDQQKGAAWDYIEGDYFGAWRGDQLVGTVAAIINHRHNEFHEERVGWFGAFEIYDDREASTALLNTAADWVKAKGYPVIRGPQTFTTHEETGLLVDNFTRPVLLYPYNKPYYEAHILAAGYTPVMDTYGFAMSKAKVEELGLFERLGRVTQSIMKRSKIAIRAIDTRHLKQEFVLFKELYNAAWEKNWGFVPMTPRELDALVNSLGSFFDSRLAFFATVEGEPAGMILGVPDFNMVLQKAYAQPGTPEIVTLLKALYYWKVKKVIDTGRVPLMGVKPQYRSKGVDVVMYYHLLKAMLESGYQYSDSGWILSNNETMVSIAKNFGAEIYKTFRYFEKAV